MMTEYITKGLPVVFGSFLFCSPCEDDGVLEVVVARHSISFVCLQCG